MMSLNGLEKKTEQLEEWWGSTSVQLQASTSSALRMSSMKTPLTGDDQLMRENEEKGLWRDQEGLERRLRAHTKEVEMESKKRQDTLDRLGVLQHS